MSPDLLIIALWNNAAMSTSTNASGSDQAQTRGGLHALAVILASLIIPGPLVTGRIVEAVLDSTNPAGLEDVTVGLAYLSEILIWSFAVLGVVVVAFLVVTLALLVRERSFRAVALPVVVAVIQLAVGVAALAANGAIDHAAGA